MLPHSPHHHWADLLGLGSFFVSQHSWLAQKAWGEKGCVFHGSSLIMEKWPERVEVALVVEHPVSKCLPKCHRDKL